MRVTDEQMVGSGDDDDMEWDGKNPEDRPDSEMVEEFKRLYGLMPERTRAQLNKFPEIARAEDDEALDEYWEDLQTKEAMDDAQYLIEMVHELLDQGVWDATLAEIKESK